MLICLKMSAESDNFTHEHLGSAPLAYEALISATFDQQHSLDPGVERLLLADATNPDNHDLRAEIELPLRRQMATDPSHEHGLAVMASPNRKLLVSSKVHHGTDKSVNIPFSFHSTRSIVAGELLCIQDRYAVASPHTHPIGLPPSSEDLQGLFYSVEDPAAMVAAWVITEGGSWMVFRGPQTPELSRNEAAAKVAKWNSLRRERAMAHVHPSMPVLQKYDINFRIQTALLCQVADAYGLQIFKGSKGSNELVRMPR